MALDLCKNIYLFLSTMSSEWLEFNENFVYALVHIRSGVYKFDIKFSLIFIRVTPSK